MKSQTKLKIIPGRGLTGRDIKNRLRNRTLSGQTFGDDAYTLEEDMVAFSKMSKIEQINEARQNSEKVKKMQNKLEEASNKLEQQKQEKEIERKVQDKLKELGKQESEKQPKL